MDVCARPVAGLASARPVSPPSPGVGRPDRALYSVWGAMTDDTDSRLDTEEEAWFNPNGDRWADPQSSNSYSAIFDAPDYSSFVKQPKTATSREYELKARSMIKSGVMFSLQHGNAADAAAFLHYGPNLASAAGHFADSSEHARKMIDMITAPDNPTVIFALAALTLTSQLLRNRESLLAQLPEERKLARAQRKAERANEKATPPRLSVRVPFTRKQIPIRFRFRFSFTGMLRSQTKDPNQLVQDVFTDENLVKELAKQNIRVTVRPK